MATVQQLMSALRKADAAGNTADANRLAQLIRQATTPVDRSFSSAFKSGIDAPLENMATTARAVGQEGIADTLSGITNAPVNYESASNRFINPEEGDETLFGFGIEYLPRAFVEQLGQYGGSLLSRAGGGTLAGAVTGGNPIAIAGGALAAPALFEFVQQLGGNAIERAKNEGREEPNWDDWTAAASTAGLSGALNALGVRSQGLLNGILREGVTEGAQSATQQTGVSLGTEKGLQLDPKQAVGEGILGGTAAGGTQIGISTATAPIKVTRAAVNVVSGNGNAPKDAEAAADFARDLQQMADDSGYDLNEVNPSATGGVKTTIDDVHGEYATDMDSLARLLRNQLGYKDTDPEAQRLDKVIAKTALKKGRNKAKNLVSKKDIAAVRKIVGKSQEGERLINLLRKSNELSRVSNAGLKGGVSQFTDIFNPLDTANQGYSAPRNLVGALATGLGGAAAYGTGGASLLPQAAAVGAGRAIDAATGRRSRVAKFIRDNAGNQGISTTANLPSVANQNEVAQQSKVLQKFLNAQRKRIDADRKQVSEDKEQQRIREINLDSLQRGDPPKGDRNDPNPSPQFIMQSATGLDARGVADMLGIIRRTRPNLKEAADSYQTMLENSTQVKDQNELIKAVKGLVLKMGGTLPDDVPQNVQQAQTQTDIKRQTGIEGNQERINQLRQDMNDDPDVTAVDKRIINRALDVLALPLGSDPVKAAQDILTEAEGRVANKTKATQYLKPYVERVRQQQKKPLSNQN